VKKAEAVNQALRAALDSWNWRPPPAGEIHDEIVSAPAAAAVSVRTELSATVYSAEATDWVRYLKLPPEQRYERDLSVRVHVGPDVRLLAFEAENQDSQWLSELLHQALELLRERCEQRQHVRQALEELLFDTGRDDNAERTVRLSPEVPSDGSRETALDDALVGRDVRLVLHSRLVRYVRDTLDARPFLSRSEKLGLCWPVVSRLVFELGYPNLPRDRFAAKIDVFAKLTYVAINVLYDERKSGRLVPNPAGAHYEHMVSASSGISHNRLMDRHPYFRMLAKLGFLLRAAPYREYSADVRVAAREYLDTLYLRLSLAGAMPEIPIAMRPMSFERKGNKVKTPNPEVGWFGIHDKDDLDAWKTVSAPFRDLGFTLLRQLGMGEFGRVYEGLNTENGQYPTRVALKVDRILGKKKNAILEAEEAMVVGRELAHSPHLIRLYDTGKLHGVRYTYHVLQLIDGETLDNLVGVTGTEHASVSRPPSARLSEWEAQQEFERAVSQRGGELWRRQRISLPFRHVLSPGVMLDLLTSVLLWLEDVHRIGYAINDLKNGNLMMSRRGQLKGIDLDSYARVHSAKDKVTDFMFLAVSLILLLFNAPVIERGRSVPWEELIESETRLRAGLSDSWPFGNVELLSDGRVTKEELLQVLVDLVHRSRHLIYTKKPDLFSDDIARLVHVKRRLLFEEFVVD
jgi:hypothetical protein